MMRKQVNASVILHLLVKVVVSVRKVTHSFNQAKNAYHLLNVPMTEAQLTVTSMVLASMKMISLSVNVKMDSQIMV